LPAARNACSRSRSARVLMMSRPFVGSSSSSVCGSWISGARDRHLHFRSPCEKPCARRSAIASMPRHASRRSMRADEQAA
jgi:hypothetical protein